MRPAEGAAALFLLLLALAAPAGAAPALRDGGAGTVVEVIDADTVRLADGREVRLVGIQAPKLPLGRRGFVAWPLAEEARAALAGLLQGKKVRLAYGGRETDRHGRALAHLYDAGGRWAQGWMLEQGWARVYTFADNVALADEMLALERQARAARRGIWAHPFYAVRRAEAAEAHVNSFELVEGCVHAIAEVGGHIYLNFDADWRTDFTIAIAPADRRRFAGIDWLVPGRQEAGALCLRVRGWLKQRNGPMIEATHPQQIERLQPGAGIR